MHGRCRRAAGMLRGFAPHLDVLDRWFLIFCGSIRRSLGVGFRVARLRVRAAFRIVCLYISHRILLLKLHQASPYDAMSASQGLPDASASSQQNAAMLWLHQANAPRDRELVLASP